MSSLLLPDPLLSLLPAFPLLTVFVLLSLGIWLIPFAEEIALMKRVKTAFDPAGILNPGKIFPPT